MKTIPRAEQETTIRFDPEDKIAHIYTTNPTVIRKMDKLCAEFPDAYRCVRTDPDNLAKWYTCPASYIRFGKPASEAQKEAARITLARIPAKINSAPKTAS